MAVHALLTALVQHNKEGIDPAVVENIWVLAERYNDVATMVTIVSRPGDVPAAVLDRARQRKEVEVRVAYLCRPELPGAERMELLAAEKRAEVFAGLLTTASGNAVLADRIVEQFRSKPTKVLARTLLRGRFAHDGVDFDCIKVLASERTMPDWMSRTMRQVAEKYQGDATKGEIIAEVLPIPLLVDVDLTALTPSAQGKAITRLAAYASAETGHRNWETRHAISRACRSMLVLAGVDNLDPAVADLLDPLSTCEWFEDGEKLAGLLAGRKTASGPVDDKYEEAKTATGARLYHLVQMALIANDFTSNVTLGLLENPQCLLLDEFAELIERAGGAVLVKALHATRSSELLVRIWQAHGSRTPEACWDHVADRDAVVRSLVADTVAKMVAENSTNPYGLFGSNLSFLLNLGVSNDVVASLPFATLDSGAYSWRYNVMLEAVSSQVVALQLEHLGNDQQAWENFNNLAQGWSGTLGELLSAAKSL